MNSLVKILSDDNGEPRDLDKQFWHLVDPCNLGGSATLCEREYFGYGESRCEYEESKGSITCPNCIAMIKVYKKVKL